MSGIFWFSNGTFYREVVFSITLMERRSVNLVDFLLFLVCKVFLLGSSERLASSLDTELGPSAS